MGSDLQHVRVLGSLPWLLKTLQNPVLGLMGPAKATKRALALGRLSAAAHVAVTLCARSPVVGGPTLPFLNGIPWEPVVQALAPLALFRGQRPYAPASPAPGLPPMVTVKLVDE